MKSILITGASGFVGSFLIEEALRQGFETWAGVRATSSRRYLQEPGTRFLELDFGHADVLRSQLEAHRREHGAFDYIVHCAGVTKCIDPAEFDRVNHGQTALFADTLRALDMVPHRFIFVSTLSVFGAIHERDFLPICETDTPQPNTAYGRSKLAAERYLQGLEGFPWVFLRPTGVYGPRERDYFLMVQSIAKHVDVAAGWSRQDLTFVYVKDVAQAVFRVIERDVVHRAYFLSDGRVYSSRTFSDLVRRELGNPAVVRIKFPLWMLKAVSVVAESWAKRRHATSTLNRDKYNIMKQRNWQCDIAPAQQELGYVPAYDLTRGVPETIAWYKANGWL